MASVSFAGKQIGLLALLIGLALTGERFKVANLYAGVLFYNLLNSTLMFVYPRFSRDIGEVSVTLNRIKVLESSLHPPD